MSGKAPVDFDTMWDDSLKSGDSARERLSELKGIAASMAAEGKAYHALERTLETLGPGDSRCSVIRAIFQASSDLESLEKCYARLDYDDEKNFATQGLSEKLTFLSSPDKIDFNKFKYLGDRFDKVVSTTVSTYIIQHSLTGRIETSDAFKNSINVGMSKDAEKAVISDVTTIVPFSCWDHIVEKGIDRLNVDHNRIVTEMVRIDPQKAIERISSEPKVSGSFSGAFTEWMKNDSSKPIEWINSNSRKLSPEQRDRAYQGIANYAVQQGDLAAAKQWAGMITDERVKDELSKESWYVEASSDN
ncbi:MAG: hypothetical protein EOP84_24345 [Verrucomicrobiaceae bacterium]|nr:MAG: hypothetical protein EOP84_24345 [Verrucomicrobiaceae bacterium]